MGFNSAFKGLSKVYAFSRNISMVYAHIFIDNITEVYTYVLFDVVSVDVYCVLVYCVCPCSKCN
jgi:hypothetical protein